MAQIALFTNDYRAIGHIDTILRIAYKSVNQMTHQLHTPPAWTYDESIINQILEYNRDEPEECVTHLVIQTTDTKLRYTITFNDFLEKAQLRPWRQNKNEMQYQCLLEYWSHNQFNQMKLF